MPEKQATLPESEPALGPQVDHLEEVQRRVREARRGEDWFDLILDEVRELRARKRQDYSKPYLDPDGEGTFSTTGWEGMVSRLYDKLRRIEGFALENIITGGTAPRNEAVRDTMLDLVVYSILELRLYDAGRTWRKDVSK